MLKFRKEMRLHVFLNLMNVVQRVNETSAGSLKEKENTFDLQQVPKQVHNEPVLQFNTTTTDVQTPACIQDVCMMWKKNR